MVLSADKKIIEQVILEHDNNESTQKQANSPRNQEISRRMASQNQENENINKRSHT